MFPFTFHLGPLAFTAYGVLSAAGFLISIWTSARIGPRYGTDRRHFWNLGMIQIAGGLVGAKAAFALVHLTVEGGSVTDLFTRWFATSAGVFYGGLVVATVATVAYMRGVRESWWKAADAAFTGVALGHAVGRIGCFLLGCCWGRPSELPWAVTFTHPEAHRVSGTPLHLPLHPTQLYDAGAEFLIFGGLLFLYYRKRFHGQVACLYFLSYAISRFLIEFLRGDPRGTPFDVSLSTSQWVSVLLLAVFLPLYFWRARTVGSEPVVVHASAAGGRARKVGAKGGRKRRGA